MENNCPQLERLNGSVESSSVNADVTARSRTVCGMTTEWPGETTMDCGAWVNDNQKVPYVIRIRGCEFGIHGADLSELISHLVAVRDGSKESLSEDLRDLRKMRQNEAKGVSLLKLLAIPKTKPPETMGLKRRI